MMEFEVRHWITNNEVGLGRGLFNRHNAIGTIFYDRMDISPGATKTPSATKAGSAGVRQRGLAASQAAIILPTSSAACAAATRTS
jgi:hypothetical protein